MKNQNQRWFSDTQTNPNALYPGAVNSPLRLRSVADDENEAEAEDQSEDDEG
jgi:hypothetical protein